MEGNIQANYCDPGSPRQNGRIEWFNSELRDELLSHEVFYFMGEIRFMLAEHRQNYKHYRPHSAFRRQTPAKFAETWKFRNQPRLAKLLDLDPENWTTVMRVWSRPARR